MLKTVKILATNHRQSEEGRTIRPQDREVLPENGERFRNVSDTKDSDAPDATSAGINNSKLRKTESSRNNSDAPDTERTRQQGGKLRQGQEQFLGGSAGENWLKVATEFCGIYDELPLWVDGYFKRIIGREFYGTSNQEDRTKNLSILRKAIQQEKVWRKIGGLFSLDDKEVLLKVLFRIEEVSNRQNDLQYEGEENDVDREVRKLWESAYFMRSPYRRKHQEQFARKLKSIVPELSHEVALEIAKTWDCLQCCYSSLTSPSAELDGLKLSKSRHRIERLKSLGNAIVPQVAIEIMRAIALSRDE